MFEVRTPIGVITVKPDDHAVMADVQRMAMVAAAMNKGDVVEMHYDGRQWAGDEAIEEIPDGAVIDLFAFGSNT